MNNSGFHRRRFLQIAAAVSLAGLSTAARAAAPVARWQGTALGAQSQLVLVGLTMPEAAPIFAQVRDEIARLEAIFSLYQSRSQISVLNEVGRLKNPASEMLEVLSLAKSVWTASEGAFDPSVQTLWQARASGRHHTPAMDDFGNTVFSEHEVSLPTGGALTLNGIAQGYVTDRIATVLRAQGLTDLVVDAGEQRMLGQRPGGGDWRAGIAAPSGNVLAQLSLRDRALATSAPAGTVLPDGQGHIIDARHWRPANRWQIVSVTHDSAAVADALSTAACCLNTSETDAMLRRFSGANLAFRA